MRTPERNFGFLLTGVSRRYARLFERESEELGLTLAQCRVLSFIARNEGVSQSRAASGTEIDQMTLVRIVDRMEADGWIERRANPDDRRAHCLYLCEAAEAPLALLGRVSESTRSKAFADLSSADRKHLVNLLDRVHSRLTDLEIATTNSDVNEQAVTLGKPGHRPSSRP